MLEGIDSFTFLITAILSFALGCTVFYIVDRHKRRDGRIASRASRISGDERMLKLLHETSQGIVSILDQPRLLEYIADIFMNSPGVERFLLFLAESPAGSFQVRALRGDWGSLTHLLRVEQEDFLITALSQRRGILMAGDEREGDLTEGYAMRRIRDLGGEACLPFVDKDGMVGFCILGTKKDGASSAALEVRGLSILAGYAAIAISNARLFEGMKKMKLSLRRSDRLASLGTLTAGLAHEIRNPLVSVQTFLQLLPERFDDLEFRTQFHELACDELERLNMLMDELLSFARPSDPNLRATDLNRTVEKMLILIGSESKKKGIEIIRDFSDNIPEVVMDREQIRQVLMNVFLNAVQAMPGGGTMVVRTVPLTFNGKSDFIQIEVKDTGVGIPEKDLDSLFNPFFTTKEQGTGLGLSIAHQIVREHRGFIDVESGPGYGTTFFITLPVDPRLYDRRQTDRAEAGRAQA